MTAIIRRTEKTLQLEDAPKGSIITVSIKGGPEGVTTQWMRDEVGEWVSLETGGRTTMERMARWPEENTRFISWEVTRWGSAYCPQAL